MIRPRFAILAVFSLLTITTNTQAVNKDKLRRAVHLPEIRIIVGYGVSGRGDFTCLADQGPQPEKIEEIEKELQDDGTDADRYSRLAGLYFRCGQSAKGKEARRKVVMLLRKQFEQHPDDPACQLRLADALDYVEELEEAETLVRRAVKDRPNDWHAWLALGGIVDSKCWRAITGGKPFSSLGPEALLRSMRAAQPTPERIAVARRYRQEAVACFDRAITLAPRESEAYRIRGASRYRYAFLDCGLRLYKGEKADFVECALGREAIPDLRKAVDLNRQEYRGIGMLAWMELMAAVHDHQVRNPAAKQPKKLMDELSESTRKRVSEDLALLEKGLQNPDKHKAAEAAEVLAFLQSILLQDFSAAVKSAHRSIELDPTREAAWDILVLSLLEAQNYRKLAAICRQRLEYHDSAHAQLLLAKAYENLEQMDRAEAVIRAGLKHEPDDFMLNLALANLLLMHSNSNDLRKAAQDSQQAGQGLPSSSGR